MANNEKSAIKKARSLYMKGHKEAFSEELPILLKLFSIDQENSSDINIQTQCIMK